jgi:hypothetical protein
MKRLGSIVTVGVLAVLAFGSNGFPATRVIGGSATQIQSAPWVVSIMQTAGSSVLLCSGAVVDASHVLTAAHCVFNQSGAPAPPSSLSVHAGISNYTTPLATDAEQDRPVSLIRVHPGYVWSSGASPDDVAVLGLASPLDLSGPSVQAATLLTSGEYPGGAAATISAFGREAAGSASDGSLNTLTTTIDAQERCGGFSNTVVPDYDAIALCASAPAGAICSGDSGGALVKADTHAIVAVASASPPGCDSGSSGVFVFIGAPEILRFIQGDNQPPTAPRATQATFVTLGGRPPVSVGSTLTCKSGNWDGQPTLAYAFLNARTGEVLQQGSQHGFAVRPQDSGITISCRAIATNSGGTALLTTGGSRSVEAAPKLEIAPLTGPAAQRGRITPIHVVLHTSATISGRFSVCLTPPARVGSRICATKRVGGGIGEASFTLGLRVKTTAPVGAARITIAATDPVALAQTKALVHIVDR